MNDSGEPEPRGEGPDTPKIDPNDNPWYLLATLYGEPVLLRDEPYLLYRDAEIREKNQQTWNRYFAARLGEKTRAQLIAEGRNDEAELTPFTADEMLNIKAAFDKRKGSERALALPDTKSHIDFANVHFKKAVDFDKYILTNCSFKGATFSSDAYFRGTTFAGGSVIFNGARFDSHAHFNFATFEGEAHFLGAIVHGPAFFGGVTFSQAALFGGARFGGSTTFGEILGDEEFLFCAHSPKAAHFGGGASFGRTTFAAKTTFRNATFAHASIMGNLLGVIFSQAKFSDVAIFAGATFSSNTIFIEALFGYKVTFESTTFTKEANFSDATFTYWADFEKTAFLGVAKFESSTFSDHATFKRAKFDKNSSFINTEMKSETSFEGARFNIEPPLFFGAKFHQATVWRGISWPRSPKTPTEAGRFIDAYACLKLEMDRLKKHEDELDFFALELQARQTLLGIWRGFPIRLYGALSNYGRSYGRPLYALLAVAVIGALLFASFGSLPPWTSAGLSIANTLNVFGFRKDFFDATIVECLPSLLKVLAAVQTVFGTVLIFLFGLGIRNKFRMK